MLICLHSKEGHGSRSLTQNKRIIMHGKARPSKHMWKAKVGLDLAAVPTYLVQPLEKYQGVDE